MKVESSTTYLNMFQRTQASKTEADASFKHSLAQQTKEAAAPAPKAQPEKVETYDFTNMTPREIHDAMSKLMRNGQMDLDQSTPLLSLTSSLSPLSRVNYDGTAPYSDAPINVFAALQQNFDAEMSRNETANAGYIKKTMDALTQLQGTPVHNKA